MHGTASMQPVISGVGAPSEAWCFLYSESLYLARLSQPPVSSVASVRKGNCIPNETDEAYTENIAGRREDVPSQSNSAPLARIRADDDDVNASEVKTKESIKARILRVCRSRRAWHVTKEVPGTWETLLPP